MKDDYLRAILTLTVVLSLALILTWFFISNAAAPSVQPEKIMNFLAPKDKDCGVAVASCKARFQQYIDICDESEALPFVSQQLSEPLKTSDCEKVQQTIPKQCPAGCMLDYSSFITVAGNVRFDLEPPNESGKCLATAQRVVTLKASCVKSS